MRRKSTRRLGDTLKTLRAQSDMSLADVMERTGVDPSHLSKIERGLCGASVEVYARLAGAYGVKLAVLFERGMP